MDSIYTSGRTTKDKLKIQYIWGKRRYSCNSLRFNRSGNRFFKRDQFRINDKAFNILLVWWSEENWGNKIEGGSDHKRVRKRVRIIKGKIERRGSVSKIVGKGKT